MGEGELFLKREFLFHSFLVVVVFLFRIEFLRHLKSFFQIMFKIETKPCGEELKGGDKVLMTCVGVGFSNLSKTLKWYSYLIRSQRLQTKQKLPWTPKEIKPRFIQDRICSYIKDLLILCFKKKKIRIFKKKTSLYHVVSSLFCCGADFPQEAHDEHSLPWLTWMKSVPSEQPHTCISAVPPRSSSLSFCCWLFSRPMESLAVLPVRTDHFEPRFLYGD